MCRAGCERAAGVFWVSRRLLGEWLGVCLCRGAKVCDINFTAQMVASTYSNMLEASTLYCELHVTLCASKQALLQRLFPSNL